VIEPYYSEDGISIYHGDCREILPSLYLRATAKPAAIVTDPPFNVGKDYETTADKLCAEEYAEMLRLIAASVDRQAWVTPTIHLGLFLQILGDQARPVIVKRGAVGPPRWGWTDQFDVLLFRGKPLKKMSNHWSDIRLKGEGYFFRENTFGHPGYTPYPLMRRMISLMAESLMVDPFCGTGTALRAAKDLGLDAIGIDVNEAYCEIAANRMRQSVFDFELWGEVVK
jgi:site-specific DNA-methyltransferase (adenine-specific)